MLNGDDIDASLHEARGKGVPQVVEPQMRYLSQTDSTRETFRRIAEMFTFSSDTWKNKLILLAMPKTRQGFKYRVVHGNAPITFLCFAVENGNRSILKINTFPSKAINLSFAHSSV